ncbi:MAG: A/G-specific adenine glycosylase [Bacteroidetes bacterium]|nr:A/G-specific adenine glycosylase [Bacteroidota bacterium]
MAQQTQVSRVAVYYRAWLKQFPSFSALASAPAADVLRAWSGLGYNSRALRFHQLAQTVVQQHRSRLPRDPEALQQLPGIGRYTAHALCSFAFGMHVPVVDVNIRRIITRWTKKVGTSSEVLPEKESWQLAEGLLPVCRSSDWNQALMDFGAMVCTARRPKCDVCPVASYCRSAHSRTFLTIQTKERKKEPVWRGIPRRLYRGKLLKLLHHHALTAEEAASALWSDAGAKDAEWTERLLDAMVRDGLLSRHGKRFRMTTV